MIEPGTITGLGIGAAAYGFGGKELVIKLLGPTAEYLGDEFKGMVQRRYISVNKIFANAAMKMGPKIDAEGSVPPKVLKGILDEGSYADDPLSIEYFGGVLASSKTEVGRDDRGAYFNSLISRMSVYQLRSHYIFYYLFKNVFNGENLPFAKGYGHKLVEFFVPIDLYVEAMDFEGNGESKVLSLDNVLLHVMPFLHKEGLIHNEYSYGNLADVSNTYQKATSGGIILGPSIAGMELFLWAYGKGMAPIHEFLLNTDEFKLNEGVKITRLAERLMDKH